MEKADYYHWLEQNRTRLSELIIAHTEAGAKAKGQVVVELKSRVELWVSRFLEYFKTGDIRIMINQVEEANRKKLARGEVIDFKSAEEQQGYIFHALSQLIDESNFSQIDKDRFLQQIERTMNNLTSTAKTIYSRLVLEQANLKDN